MSEIIIIYNNKLYITKAFHYISHSQYVLSHIIEYDSIFDYMLNWNILITRFDTNQLFLTASKKGHLEIVKLLIQNGADIHAENDYALRWASQEGHIEVVTFLIQNGADIHAENEYALRWSSENGHLEIVKILIQKGADIHANDDQALRWASENGHLEVVELLI